MQTRRRSEAGGFIERRIVVVLAATLIVAGVIGWLIIRMTDFPGPVSTASIESAQEPVAASSGKEPLSAEDIRTAGQRADAARPFAGLLTAPSKTLLEATPLPPNSMTLDGVTAKLITSDGERSLVSQEGQFERQLIREGESIALRISVPTLVAGGEVTVSASDGGQVVRRNGPLRFIAGESSADLDLSFTPTLGRGNYRIDIRHAGSVSTLAFWAGPTPPLGERGPNFVPLPEPSEIIP